GAAADSRRVALRGERERGPALPVGLHGPRLPTRRVRARAGAVQPRRYRTGPRGRAPRRRDPRRGARSFGQRRRVDAGPRRSLPRAGGLVPLARRRRAGRGGGREPGSRSEPRRIPLCVPGRRKLQALVGQVNLRVGNAASTALSLSGKLAGSMATAAVLCVRTELTRGEL